MIKEIYEANIKKKEKPIWLVQDFEEGHKEMPQHDNAEQQKRKKESAK